MCSAGEGYRELTLEIMTSVFFPLLHISGGLGMTLSENNDNKCLNYYPRSACFPHKSFLI